VRTTAEFREVLRKNPNGGNLKFKDVEKSLQLGRMQSHDHKVKEGPTNTDY
jgi:hypothetical protein